MEPRVEFIRASKVYAYVERNGLLVNTPNFVHELSDDAKLLISN